MAVSPYNYLLVSHVEVSPRYPSTVGKRLCIAWVTLTETNLLGPTLPKGQRGQVPTPRVRIDNILHSAVPNKDSFFQVLILFTLPKYIM